MLSHTAFISESSKEKRFHKEPDLMGSFSGEFDQVQKFAKKSSRGSWESVDELLEPHSNN